MMDFFDFLERVIDDGLAAVRKDYKERPDKLEGAIEGFEVCRGKSPSELAGLHFAAQQRVSAALHSDIYLRERCRQAEIEWVCNVASAALMNRGLPVITPPTVRGLLKAAEILGVTENS